MKAGGLVSLRRCILRPWNKVWRAGAQEILAEMWEGGEKEGRSHSRVRDSKAGEASAGPVASKYEHKQKSQQRWSAKTFTGAGHLELGVRTRRSAFGAQSRGGTDVN